MRDAAIGLILLATFSACDPPLEAASFPNAGTLSDGQPAASDFPVPPPPFSEGIFPCSECHTDIKVDPTPRTLEEHVDVQKRFNHGNRDRWCFDCHDPDNRDMLRLAGGGRVPFSESYRLCGQCHGDKLRDWKVGVHGKRTGSWSGKKQYLLCAHCHDPHSPHFKPLAPKPPPVRPLGHPTGATP